MTATNNRSGVPASAWWLVLTRGISALGSTLTTFGLNVWVYQQTGSFSTFAVLTLLAGLPDLLVSPIAGMIVDRSPKKRVLLLADVASALAVMTALMAHLAGHLSVTLVATTMILLAVTQQFRWAAMGPAITMLVPREELARLNGLQQSFRGLNVILGPILGGIGFAVLGLTALLAADLASFVVGIAGIVALRLAEQAATPRRRQGIAAFWAEATYGFRWVFERPPLRRLLLFFMMINVGLAVHVVTFTPYLLSFASQRQLGMALAMDGGGAFLAGLWLARRKPKLDFERTIMVAAFLVGACLMLWGACHQFALLLVLAAACGSLTSLLAVCSQTIWQQQTPVEIQGKVYAVRAVVAYGLTPFATAASIPLSQHLFEPLAVQGPWASLWGPGPAGALGMMVSTLGAWVAVCAIAVRWLGGLHFQRDDIRRTARDLASESTT